MWSGMVGRGDGGRDYVLVWWYYVPWISSNKGFFLFCFFYIIILCCVFIHLLFCVECSKVMVVSVSPYSCALCSKSKEYVYILDL